MTTSAARQPSRLPPRRILSLWCAQLAIDRWRLQQELKAPLPSGEGLGVGVRQNFQASNTPSQPPPQGGGDARFDFDSAPLALIGETAHGPRVETLNRAAQDAGVQAGSLLADARTICPELATAPADPAGNLAFLEKLALWAQRWGPWSAVDPPDGVLVDITGAAHLFGGEDALLGDAARLFEERGLAMRAAIAPTAGAAWALSHYGPNAAILEADEEIANRLAPLPVAALRLDTDVLVVLRRLGLKRLGDLTGIGRDALMRRFRNRKSPASNPLVRLDQLVGLVPEPMLPVVEVHAPLVQRRLAEPIRHRDLLDKVLGDLAQDMARVLEGRGEGARRLELGMWRVDGEVMIRSLEMAVATRDPAHICRLFADRLDDIDAGFGIETVRLRCSWTQGLALAQEDFESSAEQHGTSLAACLDRLTVRLGSQAVRRPVMRASHIPERSQGWQPPLEPQPPAQDELRFHARPLKLLDRPERIAVLYATPDGFPRQFRWRGGAHEVVRVEGPERIAPEWWRSRSTTRLRDYYRIEDDSGRRYWIYRDGIVGDGRGGMPDWYLQGLCA